VYISILLFRAFELRLPLITRNFDAGEMQHNFAVIHSTHLKWMLELVSSMHQPFLDFFLRKYFWIMILGHNEISLRLPSIVYSLGTVSVCFISPFYFLKKKRLPNFYILLACIVIALFAIDNKTEIWNSVNARHYSFISFTSAIWVSIFLFYEGKHKHYLFAFGSFLFLNAHFFSMPLILGGYAYIMTKNLTRE